jgi:hypothetical protein
MAALLGEGELLAAPEVLQFLDPESLTSLMPSSKLSAHEYLFRKTQPVAVTVSKKETVHLDLQANQHVFWSFFTEKYDIAFQITKDGEEWLPLCRYNSHTEAVEGCLRTDRAARVEIVFDNSHAKLHSKKLTYRTVVAQDDELQSAFTTVLSLQESERKVVRKRILLKNRLSVRSAELCAGGARLLLLTPMEQQAGDEERRLAKVEGELREEMEARGALQTDLDETRVDLAKEKGVTEELRAQLAQSQSALAQAHEDAAAAKKASDSAVAKRDAQIAGLEMQLASTAAAATKEIGDLNAVLAEQRAVGEALEQERDTLTTSLAASRADGLKQKSINAEGNRQVGDIDVLLKKLRAKLTESI